jgi:hypothetical protein
MKHPGSCLRPSRQDRLRELFANEFHEPHQAYDLFADFLQQTNFSSNFCLKLLNLAKRPTTAPWELRRLALLMLEHQILKLSPDNLADFDFVLTQLKLKEGPGLNKRIRSSVLKEGYSNVDLCCFIREFRRKLERLKYVHDKIRGWRTTDQQIFNFLRLSRRDCKLSLARYVLTPDEVVDEIRRQLQVTDGVKDLDTSLSQSVQDELEPATKLLPDFEANLLRKLCESSCIYWVAATTSSEINSLLEYPIGTVVLVIKPPGSHVEFEIKRAGRKGPNALNVVYSRNGYTVAPTHRLDGGCMQSLLRYEFGASSKLGFIYRLVHGTEAPIPYYVSKATVYSVPGPNGGAQTIPYFTEPRIFGKGFREMRTAMKASVAAFRAEASSPPGDIPGDLGLTVQFIGEVAPAQAILCGTTSFRLDKLAAYFSDRGPDKYFKHGLGIAYTTGDAQRLADELLEEVLGVYQAPDRKYQNYEQYLKAAFCVPANRARADQVYHGLVEQIAKFWGTLLAVGGYTRGESFVARNVGLRSVWNKGQWEVRIVFMDHDAVVIPGREDGHFYAKGALPNMMTDESYIWRQNHPQVFANSEMGCLQRIYRIGKDVAARGQTVARFALRDAYKKTQSQLLANPRLRKLFSKAFIDRLLVWDAVVGGYLRLNNHKTANARWKKEMKQMLASKRYGETALEDYLKTIENNKEFLERYSYLFSLNGHETGGNGER